MSRSIYRYSVPVDDQWHVVQMTGDIVHVAARELTYVEFWAFAGDGPTTARELRVFGTGHPIPVGHHGAPLRHIGTALVRGSDLVWHLLQRMAAEQAS